MMKSTSAATSSIRIQRYVMVMVMMKSTRKLKMTTMMMMLNGHISAKDSNPKGKKVQLRGDDDEKSDRQRQLNLRKEKYMKMAII